jgi:UDP-glucose 4-epimerase
MELSGKRFLVIGGAGFIGSHTVDALLREDVAEIRIYDNFSRGQVLSLPKAPSVLPHLTLQDWSVSLT